MSIRKRDQPLVAAVEGYQLVIRIGIDTLGHAASFHHDLYEFDTSTVAKILNNRVLAKDVCRALLGEKEDGSTPISDLLDAMIMTAYEDGSEAFEYNEEK